MKIIERWATKCPCWSTNLTQQGLPPEKRSSNYNAYYQNFANHNIYLYLHSLGCARKSADYQADRWDVATNDNAIAHAVIDSEDGDVRQVLRWDMRGWHVGGTNNNLGIGVEMCESDAIRYIGTSAKFEVLDMAKARSHCTTAYNSAVELFAKLCIAFELDPATRILSHKEGGKRGIASGHVDPEHYWNGLGMGYTMDGFRSAVALKMNEIAQNGGGGSVGYLGFPDVEETDWYADALKWAVEKHVVISDGGRFNPNNTISNAAFVVRLRRMYNALYADLKQELSGK